MSDSGARVGLAARPEGGGVDFERLRADRRSRLLREMATSGLDALVLGRPANIAFASGARQLWTAGARPFGPGCVVVAATGRVHLLSVWDEGVPPEVDHDDLYGLSWNPANLLASLQRIEGLAAARRVGTDGLTPGFPQFLAGAAPDAEIFDASPTLRSARDVKSPDEVACIQTACALAEAALSAMQTALHPGSSERDLLARYVSCLSSLGVPTPPSEAVAVVTARRGPVRGPGLASRAPMACGDLVVLAPGALYAGYEAELGRTWRVPGGGTSQQESLARRATAQSTAVINACCPGATGADVRAAWAAAGGVDTTGPIAYGLGLGAEAPVITPTAGSDEVLRPGMVLCVQAWVTEEGAGGVLQRDTVLIGDRGPRVLTAYGRDPSLG